MDLSSSCTHRPIRDDESSARSATIGLPPMDEALEAQLASRIESGDTDALGEAFAAFRDRLLRMISLRLDPRLRGRIDPEDVVQDAWVGGRSRIEHFKTRGTMTLFVWVRRMVEQALIDLHRQHLGAQGRTVAKEVQLDKPYAPADAESISLHLMAEQTSPSQAAIRAESSDELKDALLQLEELDREVLVLRHLEELRNEHVAEILGLSRQAASNRYVRALKRLKRCLTESAKNKGLQ